jgi:hypothetical protein
MTIAFIAYLDTWINQHCEALLLVSFNPIKIT